MADSKAIPLFTPMYKNGKLLLRFYTWLANKVKGKT